MDGIPAEIAQKIRMLFKYSHFDAGSGKQEAEDHSSGSSACDATANCECPGHSKTVKHIICQ
jgi:hypothetical protein